MKFVFAATLLTGFVMPALAQEGEGAPLIRVYIDTPYYYEIMLNQIDWSDPGAQKFELYVEGKEVGSSEIVYDCMSGDYTETVTSDWTGSAPDFLPAALMAYRNLFC